jgi:hypothetical protein
MPGVTRDISFVINGKDVSAQAFRSAETRLQRLQKAAGQAIGGTLGGAGGRFLGAGLVGGGIGLAAGAAARTFAPGFTDQVTRGLMRQLDMSEKLASMFGIVTEKSMQLAKAFDDATKQFRQSQRAWVQQQSSELKASLDRLGLAGGTPTDDTLFGSTVRRVQGFLFGERDVQYSQARAQAEEYRKKLQYELSPSGGNARRARLLAQFVEVERAQSGGELTAAGLMRAQQQADQANAAEKARFDREYEQNTSTLNRLIGGRRIESRLRAAGINAQLAGRGIGGLGGDILGVLGSVFGGVGLPPVRVPNQFGTSPGLNVTEARFLTRGRDAEQTANKTLDEIRKGNGFLQAMLRALTGKDLLEVRLK